MHETFRLGRIVGVRIGVNWSVLVIFGLIAFLLAAERFPTTYPGRSTAAYVAAGLATAVVFFLSLLAHEMAHALVARRNGVEVEGITLWLFGGVARLQGEASSPGAELRIAGVGPLVSLVLGAVFLSVATVLGAFDGGGGLAAVAVAWLGGINVALAVFNVIPAAPLDGGRLLRAAVWRITGNRLKATVRASQAGKLFGWFLVIFGLIALVGRGAFGGLWLALIGWFLISAATMEGQQAVMRDRLAGVSIRDIMSPEPETVPGSMDVTTFVEDYLLRHRHSAFPVTDEAGTIGLVTLNRIRQVPAAERDRMSLRDVAVPLSEVAQASPDDPVAEVLPRLSRRPEGRCLVFADGRLVGITSLSDVSRAIERMTLIRGAQPG